VGYEVAGCDVSESGIAIAQQALGNDARLECLSVYDDLAATFGRDWDVVIAAEVIEHLYSPRDLLKRVRGLLRPEGTLILTTPYHGYLKNIALAASGALDRHFTALWDGGHIKFWSYRTLTTLLQEAHFHNFRFAGAGRLPWIWKSMVVSSTRAG
jgi:2-polyprenyl-3-methyl-5-hydroxy-6-metoxy-1,4-benzoquinol methylase